MREEIGLKIENIAKLLLLKGRLKGNYGLLSGTSGISLFLSEYSKVCGNEKYQIAAKSFIEDAMDDVFNDARPLHTYCGGISGMIYLLSNFEKNNTFEYEISNDVYEYLYSFLKIEIDNKHYDFLHGALGIMFCFITRPQNAFANKVITKTLDFLNSSVIIDNTKKTAKWTNKDIKNREEYNISLSHGMSSIVMILLKIYQNIDFNKKYEVKQLIEKAINYILMQEIDHDKYGSFFPYIAIESSESLSKSRLAWCYGDLGIATTLYQAGITFDRQDWVTKSLEIFRFAAVWRRDLEGNMVNDACLCHGSSGIGHIFYRMWYNTKISEFKEAADYWFEKTLELATFEDGLEGYKIWNSITQSYEIGYGLLEGGAGIGLAMLSYCYECEPFWDECLLLSL